MRLLVALLFCLVPATTFAIPVQLSLSGTVTSRDPFLQLINVGDPFSATIMYDIAPGATTTSVSGFLYFENRTFTFTDPDVGITNGLPVGSAGEIFTEFNGQSLLDHSYTPPVEFRPGRFSIVMFTPTTFSARLALASVIPYQFTATGTVTPVPEPATLGLLATGLAIGVGRRLRKSRAGR